MGRRLIIHAFSTLSRSVRAKANLPPNDSAALASAVRFVLEALYVNNHLSKYTYRGNTFYKR